MPQRFRHVIRGMTPAEVVAHVEAHPTPWWRRQRFMVSVRGDRIKAWVPAGRTPPPVVKATLRPHPRGTEVVGRVSRVTAGIFNAGFLLVAVVSLSLGGALARDGAGGLAAVCFVLGGLLLLTYVGLVVTSWLVRGDQRDDIARALDRFLRDG